MKFCPPSRLKQSVQWRKICWELWKKKTFCEQKLKQSEIEIEIEEVLRAAWITNYAGPKNRWGAHTTYEFIDTLMRQLLATATTTFMLSLEPIFSISFRNRTREKLLRRSNQTFTWSDVLEINGARLYTSTENQISSAADNENEEKVRDVIARRQRTKSGTFSSTHRRAADSLIFPTKFLLDSVLRFVYYYKWYQSAWYALPRFQPNGERAGRALKWLKFTIISQRVTLNSVNRGRTLWLIFAPKLRLEAKTYWVAMWWKCWALKLFLYLVCPPALQYC